MLPGREASAQPSALEEIGRSCYITGRQSDVCQSHAFDSPGDSWVVNSAPLHS